MIAGKSKRCAERMIIISVLLYIGALAPLIRYHLQMAQSDRFVDGREQSPDPCRFFQRIPEYPLLGISLSSAYLSAASSRLSSPSSKVTP